jgi:hypothetical protein
MARGWESKAVESQVEDREARERAVREAELAPADPAAAAARRTVELALHRAEADLAASTSPAHRAMLEQAIAALRRQLETA